MPPSTSSIDLRRDKGERERDRETEKERERERDIETEREAEKRKREREREHGRQCLVFVFALLLSVLAAIDQLHDLVEHRLLQHLFAEGRCKATWKKKFELPWREAVPPNYHDDKVESDQ